ncbi:hypothetical protein [Neisseria sp.]|uniref:hypothetical protein n=1 Tax=Neisseria sp. TaxID=192066 RepID=UPI00359F51CA
METVVFSTDAALPKNQILRIMQTRFGKEKRRSDYVDAWFFVIPAQAGIHVKQPGIFYTKQSLVNVKARFAPERE